MDGFPIVAQVPNSQHVDVPLYVLDRLHRVANRFDEVLLDLALDALAVLHGQQDLGPFEGHPSRNHLHLHIDDLVLDRLFLDHRLAKPQRSFMPFFLLHQLVQLISQISQSFTQLPPLLQQIPAGAFALGPLMLHVPKLIALITKLALAEDALHMRAAYFLFNGLLALRAFPRIVLYPDRIDALGVEDLLPAPNIAADRWRVGLLLAPEAIELPTWTFNELEFDQSGFYAKVYAFLRWTVR